MRWRNIVKYTDFEKAFLNIAVGEFKATLTGLHGPPLISKKDTMIQDKSINNCWRSLPLNRTKQYRAICQVTGVRIRAIGTCLGQGENTCHLKKNFNELEKKIKS